MAAPPPLFTPSGDASADVVIVGSGVVGANVAHQLVQRGLSVLVLEAGPRVERWQVTENWRNVPLYSRARADLQRPYDSAPNAPMPRWLPENGYLGLSGPNGGAYKQGYLKVVGGTTWHWAASCWRHLPADMRLRSLYGVGRDWPIAYSELEPYYCRAEEAIGVAGPSDPARQSPPERSKPYPMEMVPWSYYDRRFAEVVNPHGYNLVPIPQGRGTRVYDGRPACCGNNNCQPICPIGAMYNGIHHVLLAERAGARVQDQAVAYKAETDERNRIAAVHWYDADKVSHHATARAFVFACNGIETPRLLLMAADGRNPRGLANGSDQVGRNMMDHSGLHASFLAGEPLWAGRGPVQSSCMVGPRDGAFRSEYSANKIILNNTSQIPTVVSGALATGLVGKQLDDEIRRRAACAVDLSISLEPLPDPENRLTLSPTRRDPLDLPCPDVRYAVGDYVERGAAKVREQVAHIASLFDATDFAVTKDYNANNHVMGGCIMGADPATSVVDGNCRSHDHGNLWLPGGAAIPSASVVNTTLTMAALAFKAADDVARALEHG